MRMLKRNEKRFDYRAYLGKAEILTDDGKHTGRYEVRYADPVEYVGSISPARSSAYHELFGIDVKYTHVIQLGRIGTGIDEQGLVEWDGGTYEVTRVSETLNVTAAAINKRPTDHKPL